MGGCSSPVLMRRDPCWVIDKHEYRPCPEPAREFRAVASLHNHSCHSTENLAALNRVITFRHMRPFRRLLQRSFGLGAETDLSYAELKYNPPFRPADVWRMESDSVRRLGFDSLLLAITDHDSVSGGWELLRDRAGSADNITLGEELSVRFSDHLFHLGVTGLPSGDIHATHHQLQTAAREGRLDDLFEFLGTLGCLVVLNHPLLPWDGNRDRQIPVLALMRRFGWAIHALEYNGMRDRTENDQVLQLARQLGKPVVGGGDSHLLVPSSTLCVATDGLDSSTFVEEIKAGRTMPLLKNEYFAPLGWKLTLRVLSFIASYRKIAYYKGTPVESIIGGDWILLDPVGKMARAFLRLVSSFGMLR